MKNQKITKNEELEELESIPEIKSRTERKKISSLFTPTLPPLLRLTRRTTVFLFLTLIATILFFITGNSQVFLDKNLNMLLKIIAFNAIALSFFSFAASFECIFFTLKNKMFKLIFHLVFYILVFAVSITISILSLSINLLSEGINF